MDLRNFDAIDFRNVGMMDLSNFDIFVVVELKLIKNLTCNFFAFNPHYPSSLAPP